MKKYAIAIVMLCFALSISAQEKPQSPGKGVAFGFQLGQYQKDFGLGVNITSPYFLYENVALRLRGNLMYYEHVMNGEVTWTPYSQFSLGVASVGGRVGNFMRLYGEGGVMMILPSNDFSAESTDWGGYGIFGFEFFMQPHFNYFIEIGGVGSGARADKIPTNPIYSNGLIIQTGFRIQL